MKGLKRSGRPQVCQGDTVKFIFAGDPVTGTGCINSNLIPPSDVRFTMSVGPINMAPGVSQEVVYAAFVAKDTSNLNSITRLRDASALIQNVYDNNFEKVPFVQILPPNLYNPPFLINVKIENALSVIATLKLQDGFLLGEVELFDDGNYNDSLPNDGIWGNWLNSSISEAGACLSLNIKYSDESSILWEKIISGIPTIGKPEIVDFDVISDNINGDKIINPGEYIRYRIKLKNTTSAKISGISFKKYTTTSPYVFFDGSANDYSDTLQIGEINNWIPQNYFHFNISKSAPAGHLANIIYQIYSKNGNQWLDTISILVEDFYL